MNQLKFHRVTCEWNCVRVGSSGWAQWRHAKWRHYNRIFRLPISEYIQLYSPLLVEKSKSIKKENQTNNKGNDKKST